MKFYSKIKPDPEIGAKKFVNKFCIFPKRLGDYILWLETIIHTYEYKNVKVMSRVGLYYHVDKWVLISTEQKKSLT